jgi:hypothetical protein
VSINVTTFSAPTGHRAYLVAVASAPLAFSDVPPLLAPSQVTEFMPGTPSTVTIKQRQWQMVSGKATVAGKPGAVFALLWRKSNTSYLLIAYGAGAKYLTNGAKPFEQFARSFTPGSGA